MKAVLSSDVLDPVSWSCLADDVGRLKANEMAIRLTGSDVMRLER
jgi:hypothetical protein